MNVYAFNTYIEALNQGIEEWKVLHPQGTLAKLANTCLMQPSYVTNVLKGRCDFNSDQLFRFSELLGLKPDEIDYLNLLLELKKTNYEKRRAVLEKKINEIRKQNLRVEKNLSVKTVELSAEQLEQYYLDPYIQLAHIFINSKDGKCNIEDVAKQFSIARSQAGGILNTLESLKYIKRKGNHFEILVEGRHLPRDSQITRPHQMLMRMKSIDQIQRLPIDNVYSFSATISTLPEVRTKIQAEFIKFLKSAEKLVTNHKHKNLYQMNFDLFPWDLETET
jgi:hypothetical protein